MLAANRFKVFLYLKSIRVRRPSSTSKTTSPPFPPSPPAGPPFGTYFHGETQPYRCRRRRLYIYFDLIYKHNVLRSKPLKTPLVQPNFNQTFVTRDFKTHDINVLISILPNIIKSRWIGKGAVKIKVQNQLSVRMIRLKRNR